MKIRSWSPGDRAACLALFDSNVPAHFQPWERSEFAAFLDDLPGPFLVFEEDNAGEAGGEARVVACGGVAREIDGGWSVCWTVVARDRQRSGLGSRLMEALVEVVRREELTDPGSDPVSMRLETLPGTEAFFRRHRFRTVERTPDHYGPGLDRVEMRRLLERRSLDPGPREAGP